MRTLIRVNTLAALALIQACSNNDSDDNPSSPNDKLDGLFAKVALEIDPKSIPEETPSNLAPLLRALTDKVTLERGKAVDVPLNATSEATLSALFAKILGTNSALFFPLDNLASAGIEKAESRLVLQFSVSETYKDDEVCFSLSAQDVRALVSPDTTFCLEIAQPVIPNRAPAIGPISRQIAIPGQQVILTASASDRDGDTLIFQWQQLRGPVVLLEGASSPQASFVSPDLLGTTELVFQVTATDPSGAFAAATAAVTVEVVNSVPIVNAGIDQIVSAGSTVSLAGSASDPDGDQLNVEWQVVDGESVTLNDPFRLDPQFTVPSFDFETFVSLRLKATDPAGAVATDNVVVVVVPLATVTPTPTAPAITPSPTATAPPATPTPSAPPTASPYGGTVSPTPTVTAAPYGGGIVTPTPLITAPPSTPTAAPYGGGITTPTPTPTPMAPNPTPNATPMATPPPPTPTAAPYGGKLLTSQRSLPSPSTYSGPTQGSTRFEFG